MIAIIDYGVGNLFSLSSSLKSVGADAAVTADADVIRAADGIVLPGVGAFSDAYKKLEAGGLADVVKAEAASGKKLLGICLGMQLLFDRSYEYGEHKGLGLITGDIVPMAPEVAPLKVPHMGWNDLTVTGAGGILRDVKTGEHVYFVHSYYAQTDSRYITSYAEYGGIKITASVQNGNVFGTQFHPEKSGAVGLKILKAFADMAEE